MQIEQNEPTVAEHGMPEPQAFVVDPEQGWDLVPISKGQMEALRNGDVNAWDDLAAHFKAQTSASGEGSGDSKGSGAGKGFLAEIEPSMANQRAWDQARQMWESCGAIAPPFEKDLLCRIARMSGVLQECIHTYCTVIEGFGHNFVPVLDPDADEAFDQVKWVLWNDGVEAGESVEEAEPPDDEVNKKIDEIRRNIKFEKMRAERFFRNAARIKGEHVGFIQLRQRLRQDYETVGEWYLEILRDMNGAVRRLSYIPSVSMRKMPLDTQAIPVAVPERVNDFSIQEQVEHRHFRRYVQVDPENVEVAYFKEFGDPRTVSSRTGRYYADLQTLEVAEPGVRAATEVITDGIPDPETAYGIARWTANSPAIGGSRKAEEVNFSYFDNKTIPPFMILVSGGRLSSQAQARIKTYLKALKGSENFHKLLVLEAAPFASNVPGQPPQRVQIEVVPLIKYLKEDGLFLNYLAFNDTRIGANFACPPLLRGRSEEYTRATARETLRFFEKLVAQPERTRFDELINTKVMLVLGLALVKYNSLGADTSDPEVVAKVLDVLLKHGSMTPADGRQEAEKLLRRELPKLTAKWLDVPLKLSIAEVATRGNIPQGERVADEIAGFGAGTPEPGISPGEGQTGQNQQAGNKASSVTLDELRKQLRSGIYADLFGDEREEIWIGEPAEDLEK